jgi:hypothetical protein
VLHERHHRDPAAAGRFAREAELARLLDHPNLVGVHDVVELEGRPTLLMDLVEGRTLAELIAAEAPLAETRVLELAQGIANGLWVAHAAGVIHRDLKPANILLDEGEHGTVPRIADFGMARATSFSGVDAAALTVLGTPDYMAPECLDPLAIDPRADLYALGCIIHEMATGTPPYSAATPFAVLEAHRHAPVPGLPASYSPGLAALTHRLLAKQRGDRPQSARAVVAELSAIAGAGPETARSLPRAGGALVPAEPMQGRCAGCDSLLVPEVTTCFGCGLPLVRLRPGPVTVFVIGPGRLSEKLSAPARERLLAWVRQNPSLGLDPGPLEHLIPRLPFVLAQGVDDEGAAALVGSLQRLGLQAEARRGGRFAHEGMLSKGIRLGGRRSAIVAAVAFAPALLHPMLGLVGLVALAPVLPILFGVTASRAATPVMRVRPGARPELPPRVAARLDLVSRRLPQLQQARHREALRAVVLRVVALVREWPPDARPEVDAEMEHALNLATVAVVRMDELDSAIARPDFDAADPAQRADLHERDRWAGRLLDLTATLDALWARQLAAQVRLREPELADALAQIRADVEALEEVQRS